MKNKALSLIVLSCALFITAAAVVYGQGDWIESLKKEFLPAVTDGDNDRDDMTIDSTDGPLKIQFQLEHYPQSPNFYDVQDYSFQFNGLQQGNYILEKNEPFGGRILVDKDSVSFLGLGSLAVKNGSVTDIMPVSGHITVDKIREDAIQTIYSLGDGLVTIGDLRWYDIIGNLTTTVDGDKGALVLIDSPGGD